MKWDYHVIVIGAGSAGLVVASGAATLGAKVALIEGDKMGGDCLNSGCIPSKTFLKCAHLSKEISNSKDFGITATINPVNLENVMERVRFVIDDIAPHDSKSRYEGLGVNVFKGHGELIDNHTVKINGDEITGKTIVLATGSEPAIPNIKGLEQISYLTNKNIFSLKKLPEHLIVLGAGPIGLELGQGFRHLGSKVTIIDQSRTLFVKDEPEVSPILEEILIKDGIQLKLGSGIKEIKKVGDSIIVVIQQEGKTIELSGDSLLVSLGRRPVSNNLGLEKVGVKTTDKGFIVTNEKLQTSIPNIYACGDCTGPFQFTHMAGYQAGIVVRNTIFHLGARVNYSAVPWTTYTRPEVAHVGYTEAEAKKLNLFKESITIPLNKLDRAKTENDLQGFLKIIINPRARIIGATIVGEKGGEMIPIATLAISQKLKASVFLSIIFSYPTESEIFKFAALEILKKSYKPWQGKLIKTFFLR